MLLMPVSVLELNAEFVPHLLERVERLPHPQHLLRQVALDVVSDQLDAVASFALKQALLGRLQ